MKKLLVAAVAASMLFANIYAQDDWGSDDGWGDSSQAAGAEGGEKSLWDRLVISGDADLAARYYFDTDADFSKTPVVVIPQLKIGLSYEGEATNFNGKINLTEDVLKYHAQDVLDEFSANLFVGDFVLSAGKMRVVWGKGDKVHVLDNFNANDYTNFYLPDYLDRRTADYMIRAQYNAPNTGIRVEGIYTPIMTGERYASKGVWVPNKVSTIESLAKGVVANQLSAAAAAPGGLSQAIVQASSISSDDLYPNTNSLDYGQFGLYVNFPVGPVDIGVSYYNGHYKQVTADLSGYTASAMAAGGKATVLPSLHYDKLQTFGLDAQSAVGPFTVRAELAYNLTKDTDGDDPWVRNNSIAYLVGFDVGLPIHNLNLNVQEYGTVVLKSDKAEDADSVYFNATRQHVDADTDNSGKYTNNKIVVQLKDTFYYEKVEAVIKAIYGIERQDLFLMPEISYKVRDGWKATLSGLYIHSFGEKTESEAYGWLDNSCAQLAVHYSF